MTNYSPRWNYGNRSQVCSTCGRFKNQHTSREMAECRRGSNR